MFTTLARLIAAAGVALTVLPVHAAISTFDSDAEGWTAQGDVEGPLTWSATGGNPDGHAVSMTGRPGVSRTSSRPGPSWATSPRPSVRISPSISCRSTRARPTSSIRRT